MLQYFIKSLKAFNKSDVPSLMNREGQDQLHELHIKLNQPLYRKVSLAGEKSL